jgi:polyhydroxyalkanoate synthesis regulator phasin
MSEMDDVIKRFKACQESCRQRQDELLSLAKEAAEKGNETLYHRLESMIHREIAEDTRLQERIDHYQQ